MNLINSLRDGLFFASVGGSGMAKSTVAICARAISPSLSAREIAFKPPIFDVMSMGTP
ncbi:MAG: hypothetical protein ACLQUZ_10685 [Rhizomicrobium sp.]